MIKEEMEESAKRYFQTGGTVEIALKVFPALTEEELIAFKQKQHEEEVNKPNTY